MIGIGLATATAGVIVGTVTLTGVGQVMADLVEFLSGGNLILMLVMVGLLEPGSGHGAADHGELHRCVKLVDGGRCRRTGRAVSGLIVPLIAVHLFVFYFRDHGGCDAACGPGQSFAAAAVSGGDAIRTGFTAFFYSLRTVALPFVFIFNTDLLLIDVTWMQGIIVFIAATIAILVFTAGTMGYFLTREPHLRKRGACGHRLCPVPARLLHGPPAASLCSRSSRPQVVDAVGARPKPVQELRFVVSGPGLRHRQHEGHVSCRAGWRGRGRCERDLRRWGS